MQLEAALLRAHERVSKVVEHRRMAIRHDFGNNYESIGNTLGSGTPTYLSTSYTMGIKACISHELSVHSTTILIHGLRPC